MRRSPPPGLKPPRGGQEVSGRWPGSHGGDVALYLFVEALPLTMHNFKHFTHVISVHAKGRYCC